MEQHKHNLTFILSLTQKLLRNNPYYVFTWLFMRYAKLRIDRLLSSQMFVKTVSDEHYEKLTRIHGYSALTNLSYETCALVRSGNSNISSKTCAYVCSKITRKKYKIFIAAYDGCEDGQIIMSETTVHNVHNALGHELDHQSYFVMPIEQECVTIATEATLSMISNPYSCADDLIDCLLRTYFRVPRYVRSRDLFAVELKTYAPEHFYSSANNCPDRIFFRVNSLKIRDKKVVESTTQGAYILKGRTTLSRSSDRFARLPSECFESVGMQSGLSERARINICTLPKCPPSLDIHLSSLLECISPFLQTDVKMKIRPVFLIEGPPGSGKFKLIECLAKRTGLNLMNVDFSEIQSASAAQTEAKLRIILQNARTSVPCILRLSNIQIFGTNSEGKKDERIISAFASELEKLKDTLNKFPVIVIATLENDELEADLERLFVDKICLEHPDKSQRANSLSWFLKIKGLDHRVDLMNIAGLVSDFELADLETLVTLTAKIAYACSSTVERGIPMILDEEHFSQACELMQDSFSDRVGAPRIPKVFWEDIGGLASLKHEIKRRIELPMLNTMGLGRSGLLLYGPPGTGKTLLAKAVATECQLHFMSVKGPELLNMYVGQSEKNIRQVFERARAAAPCVIFFDELDSLAPNRGRSGDSGGVMDRVVSQLLAEMDGLESSGNIFIIAATNRPDLIDPALLRPGRFDKMLYVGIYDDRDSKLGVLKAVTRRFRLRKNGSELEEIVDRLPKNLTGADLYAVCSDAWLHALRRYIDDFERTNDEKSRKETLRSKNENSIIVDTDDFLEAVKNLVPSLSNAELARYEKYRN